MGRFGRCYIKRNTTTAHPRLWQEMLRLWQESHEAQGEGREVICTILRCGDDLNLEVSVPHQTPDYKGGTDPRLTYTTESTEEDTSRTAL